MKQISAHKMNKSSTLMDTTNTSYIKADKLPVESSLEATDVTTTFSVIKQMNLLDTAEIVEINVWKHNHHTIYGIYSPPNNKCLNLDILDLTNNTVIVRDLNAASPNWGYTYKNAPGKAVEEFLAANTVELLYKPKDPPTYLH
jgi:hypothetical protein